MVAWDFSKLKNIIDKNLLAVGFILFLCLHLLSYLSIYLFHSLLTISPTYPEVHRYLQDERVVGGDFHFLRSLSQSDAQWYLHIADFGYPKSPNTSDKILRKEMGALSYVFFPLFPITIAFVNNIFHNVETSAFLVANILIVSNFFSLYVLCKSIHLSTVTFLKIVFLLFFSPFSIFFRTPFTEGLLLFTLVWFLIFFIQKKYIFAAIFLGLNFITRAASFLVFGYFLYALVKNRYPLHKLLFSVLIVILPMVSWITFNYLYTDHLFFFLEMRKFWVLFDVDSQFLVLFMFPIFNLFLITQWPWLSLHSFGGDSKIDTSLVGISFVGLLKARKVVQKEIWESGVLIFIFPLIVTTLMSFCRYNLLILPLFFYLGQTLKNKMFAVTLFLFFILSIIVNVFFINAYWIG